MFEECRTTVEWFVFSIWEVAVVRAWLTVKGALSDGTTLLLFSVLLLLKGSRYSDMSKHKSTGVAGENNNCSALFVCTSTSCQCQSMCNTRALELALVGYGQNVWHLYLIWKMRNAYCVLILSMLHCSQLLAFISRATWGRAEAYQ